jgi:hypothetical protein
MAQQPQRPGGVVVSAVSKDGGVGLSIMLARSMGILTSFGTTGFLRGVGAQVDERDLLLYITVVFALWLIVEAPLRSLVAWLSVPGLGWQYNNVTLVDFFGQVLLFLEVGTITNVVVGTWLSGSHSVGEMVGYGVTIAILFFSVYTQINMMFGDMMHYIAVFEADLSHQQQQNPEKDELLDRGVAATRGARG